VRRGLDGAYTAPFDVSTDPDRSPARSRPLCHRSTIDQRRLPTPSSRLRHSTIIMYTRTLLSSLATKSRHTITVLKSLLYSSVHTAAYTAGLLAASY